MSDFILNFELAKVDGDKRIVAGYASTNQVDTQGDLIPSEVIEPAFDGFVKTINSVWEMHQKPALGRVEYWKMQPDGKLYVEVYLSKATDGQDTLTKAREKILKGFSIGGRVLSWETAFDPKTNAAFRKLTKIFIRELSLVDSPANTGAVVTLLKAERACPHCGYMQDDDDDLQTCVKCNKSLKATPNADNQDSGERQKSTGGEKVMSEQNQATVATPPQPPATATDVVTPQPAMLKTDVAQAMKDLVNAGKNGADAGNVFAQMSALLEVSGQTQTAELPQMPSGVLDATISAAPPSGVPGMAKAEPAPATSTMTASTAQTQSATVTIPPHTEPMATTPPSVNDGLTIIKAQTASERRQKVARFASALADHGSFLKASEIASGDQQEFDELFHAAIFETMSAGGWTDENYTNGTLNKAMQAQKDGNRRFVGHSTGLIDYSPSNELKKGFVASTAPGYYLQRLVRLMIPVFQPMRRRIAAEPPEVGAVEAHWKALLGFGTLDFGTAMYNVAEAGVTVGSTTGAGATMNENSRVLDFAAPYGRIAWNDVVSLEGIYATRQYDDPFQIGMLLATAALLKTEELQILYGNNAALGNPASITVTSAGSGTLGGATDKFAVTALCGYGWQLQQAGTGGAGGAATVAGESGRALSSAIDISAKLSVTITWPAVKGAVAYNLYYVPSGVEANSRYIGTYFNSGVTLTAVPGSGAIHPTNDGTANTNGFEGLVAWSELSTVYTRAIPSKTNIVFDHAGANLSLVGANSIQQFDNVLQPLWRDWHMTPSLILCSGNSALHAANIIGSATNPPFRVNLMSGGAQGAITGGLMATSYANKFAWMDNQQPLIPILGHPYMPDGTFLFLTESVRYPLAREARGFALNIQIPYTYFPFASNTFSYPFGLITKETLICNHPSAQGAIQNVKVT